MQSAHEMLLMLKKRMIGGLLFVYWIMLFAVIIIIVSLKIAISITIIKVSIIIIIVGCFGSITIRKRLQTGKAAARPARKERRDHDAYAVIFACYVVASHLT